MNKIEEIITDAEVASQLDELKLVLDPSNPMQSARDVLGIECVSVVMTADCNVGGEVLELRAWF